MAITCSKFLSQLLVSSFQLLLPVVVSCIVWMFVVRLWFLFWGQWQNCRLIWTFSCGVLLYYCTCANHTPFQIVQWQVGLRKRSVFLESDESGVYLSTVLDTVRQWSTGRCKRCALCMSGTRVRCACICEIRQHSRCRYIWSCI